MSLDLLASNGNEVGAALFGSMMTIVALMAWSKVSSDNAKSEKRRVTHDANYWESELKKLNEYPKALEAEKQKYRELAQKNPKYHKPVTEELKRRGIDVGE
jgi:hypothetical protein